MPELPDADPRLPAAVAHATSTRTLRALFLSEGQLGNGILGLARAHEQLQRDVRVVAGVRARHVQLPPMSSLERVVSHSLPPLKQVDLDLGPLRWQYVQQRRARQVLLAALDCEPADVIHVFSHAIALDVIEVVRRIPTVVGVDVTVDQWHRLGRWRRYRPWSPATIAPILRRERRLFEEATAVVTLSPWAANAVREIAPTARIETIPLGVDLEEFRPAARQDRAVPRVLFVAAHFSSKGGSDLLAALGAMCRSGQIHLDIVTPTRCVSLPNTTVHRLRIGDPALAELFRQADIFCLPTRADASPFAVLEAMACGTAIVATAVGGIPDQLGHGSCGVLVPPGEPAQLAAAVRALVADPARRRALGAAARARAESAYDATTQTGRLLDLMRSIAS